MMRNAGKTWGACALVTIVAVAIAGCDDKKATATAPAASSLAPSVVAPTGHKTIKLVIDPKSTTSIDMPAPKEHIKAGTDVAAGTLEIDPTNLASTRGEIKADLTTLKTRTFDDAKKDDTQTVHARTWLEVADGEDGKLPDDVKSQNRWAIYAIRSVDKLSAADLTKVTPTKEGADDVRTVTATTHGDLLIHGHKSEHEADVEVRFHYPAGAAIDAPSSVVITSVRPLRTTLADHDIKPRDGLGKLAKGAFNLIGTKVAETADVTLAFKAAPQP
ncbi:MAG: hypothetical protein JWP97_6582 [Labilithrix sp.]|nr:hypothetical protein [Labilithrix sp.]